MDFTGLNVKELVTIVIVPLILLGLAVYLLIPVLGGFINSILILSGRCRLQLAEGRPIWDGVHRARSRRFYYLSDFELETDEGRRFECGRLNFGPGLHRSKVLSARSRGSWLLASFGAAAPERRKAKPKKNLYLLGACDGRSVHFKQHDLLKLFNLEAGHAFLAGFIGLISPGLILALARKLNPEFQAEAWDANLMLISLISGALAFLLLLVPQELAYGRLKRRGALLLNDFADRCGFLETAGASPQSSARRLIFPLSILAAFCLIPVPLVFFALYAPLWLISIIFILGNFSLPDRLEVRRLKILERRPAGFDCFGRKFFRDAVLAELDSGRQIRAGRLYAARELVRRGFINKGVEGSWLMCGSGLDRGPGDAAVRSLSLAAYYDGTSLHYRRNDFAALCALTEFGIFLPPLVCPLFNLFHILKTGVLYSDPFWLALLLAMAALPLTVTALLKKDVFKAAEVSLKKGLPVYYLTRQSGKSGPPDHD